MRIAEFTDSFLPIVDGVGTVVLNYANTLADKGHECYVMAPMTDSGYRGGYKFELVDYHSVKIRGQQYKLGLPPIDTHFHARMKLIELDIIHAHSPFTAGQTALSTGKKRGIPVVGTFHSKYRDDFLQATGLRVAAEAGARLVADFYSRCDEVWTVSRSSADTLCEYGYTGEIFIVPNGTDGHCAPKPEKEVRKAFSIGELPYFLYVGQINWKKNLDCILLASKRLKERGLAFRLVLTGKGPHEEEVKGRAEALGISENTVLTGHISDEAMLSGLYAAASLFVFPSLYDTAGLVVREAALEETASVVVRGSAPAEVISGGKNGLLCEDRPEDLAKAMEFALTNPDDAKRMGEYAKKTIPVRWDSIIDEVIGRYEYLVGKNRR